MKNIIKAVLLSSLLLLSAKAVYADEVFLCMHNKDNVAITVDSNGYLEYINMKASNGASVTPLVSVDGNTYLPFRFICELSGLSDASQIEGDIPDNSFRFINATADERQKIEIKYGGNYVCHEVGTEFSYSVSEGDTRYVAIYNINGSLYFPMTYMAKLTNAKSLWSWNTRTIIYASEQVDTSKYLDENNDLRYELLLKNGSQKYANTLNNSGHYQKSDGTTVENLSDILSEEVTSADRIKHNVYFTNKSGVIKYKDESYMQIKELTSEVRAERIFAYKNKLYGTDIKTSRLFSINPDGTELEYITDNGVSNVFVREYNHESYLYYCEKDDTSKIHFIPLRTMDNYEIEVTDFDHNSYINNVKSFVVGDDMIAYIDYENKLHTVRLSDPLEEFEILRVTSENYRAYTEDENGISLSGSIVNGINYDNESKNLYISTDSGIFTLYNNNTLRRTWDGATRGIYIFKNQNGESFIKAF